MLKKIILSSLVFCVLFSLCSCSDGKIEKLNDNKFDPSKYGFENNFGMTKWIEVTEFDLENGLSSTAVYLNPYTVDESQIMFDYKTDEVELIARDLYDKSFEYTKYQLEVLNNDTAILCVGGRRVFGINIVERYYNAYGHLVIELDFDGEENMFFVLANQVEEKDGAGYSEDKYPTQYTYRFK